MKNKTYLVLASLIIALFAVGFMALRSTFDIGKGKILGTSVNKLYLQKKIESMAPPTKVTNAPDLNILANSAVLMRQIDKYPLYEKNSRESVPVASITKVMTAVVVLEKYKLDRVVEIKKENTDVIPSKIFLVTGEKISIENLLSGALIASGNDAALALSTIDTTQPEFVALMNRKAEELGLIDTKFFDPAGLNDEGKSSARDIAVLFSYALNNETFKKIVGTKEADIKSADGTQVHQVKNSNRLLTGEIPIDGIVLGGKTGVTDLAGHTLVCAVNKNNTLLIGVILNTASNSKSASAEEMKKMFDWGYQAYSL